MSARSQARMHTPVTKKNFQAPNVIIPFKNPDKAFQQQPTEDLFFLPHSSRVIFYRSFL